MEYSFGSLWNAENSLRNFLVFVLWNFGTSEEYPVVHGPKHVDFAYRRLFAHSISPPPISIWDKDIYVPSSSYCVLQRSSRPETGVLMEALVEVINI